MRKQVHWMVSMKAFTEDAVKLIEVKREEDLTP
jgi:hypothetical protein